MQNYKTYLLIFLFTAFSLIALHGLVVWKGFAMYGEGASFLDTQSKIAFRNDGKFAKTAHVSMKDFRADGYLIGSSRLRDGLDPATAEALTGKRFFNYGVSGLVVKEMKPLVDHLLTYKKPEIIVIGLDFFAFNDFTKPATDMVLGDGIGVKNFLKMYLSSFSVKTARGMLDIKGEYKGLTCNINGFCHDTRFSPSDVAHYIDAGQKQTGTKGTPLQNYVAYDESMEIFGQLLDELKRENIQVYFFFSPSHILSYHYLQKAGLLDLYISWKNDVSDAIMARGFGLWDFDIKSPATSLKRADSSEWFNDDLHYTKKFGDVILETVLAGKDNEYGLRMTPERLETILRYNAESYPAQNPADY